MKHFTGAEVDKLRAILNPVLKELGEKHGYNFDIGTMSYSDTDVRFTTTTHKLEEGVNPEHVGLKADLKKYGPRYGLSEDDFMVEIDGYKGEKLKILGIKPRSGRYPIVVLKEGKRYKYPASVLSSYLEEKKKSA